MPIAIPIQDAGKVSAFWLEKNVKFSETLAGDKVIFEFASVEDLERIRDLDYTGLGISENSWEVVVWSKEDKERAMSSPAFREKLRELKRQRADANASEFEIEGFKDEHGVFHFKCYLNGEIIEEGTGIEELKEFLTSHGATADQLMVLAHDKEGNILGDVPEISGIKEHLSRAERRRVERVQRRKPRR